MCSIFVNVNDCWLLQKLFVYHRYKFSLEKKKKKKKKKESQYMVSHPENGSDSPIGSDRDRGRDMSGLILLLRLHLLTPAEKLIFNGLVRWVARHSNKLRRSGEMNRNYQNFR